MAVDQAGWPMLSEAEMEEDWAEDSTIAQGKAEDDEWEFAQEDLLILRQSVYHPAPMSDEDIEALSPVQRRWFRA